MSLSARSERVNLQIAKKFERISSVFVRSWDELRPDIDAISSGSDELRKNIAENRRASATSREVRSKCVRISSVFGNEVRSNVETEGWAGWVNVATSRGELASFRRSAIRRVAAQSSEGFRSGGDGTCTALEYLSEYGPE